MNFIIFAVLQITELFLKSTPTPYNPWIGEKTGITPPVGWVLAGFLILLLISMIYQEIRKFIKSKLRKKSPNKS